MKVKVKLLSCVRLCDPMDCSLPGSSIHGLFQARVLEWVAIFFSTRDTKIVAKLGFGHWPAWPQRLGSCCCSAAKSCPTLWDPMDCSTPGFPVPHHLPEFAQTQVHWVSDAIQPSCPLLPLSPLALNSPSIRVFSRILTLVLFCLWNYPWSYLEVFDKLLNKRQIQPMNP